MTRFALSLLVLTTVAASCRSRPNAQASSAASAAADTLVGVVTEVGADPGTWMTVRPKDGMGSIRLSGDGVAALRNVAGAEVWLSGARANDDFRVDAFEVRRVNDQPVDDGIVVTAESGVAIRMRSGVQRSVPHAPPGLRSIAGARVWITRPVADRAPSFGVIESGSGNRE